MNYELNEIKRLRIEQLLEELSQCREDERNGQSTLMSLLAAAVTALTIFFGASSMKDICNQSLIYETNSFLWGDITIERVFFWLSSLIFIASFSYATIIAIANTLRYFYTQNIEERLHCYYDETKLDDDEGRGVFLHYPEYVAPIITMRFKHISSSHTLLNYCAYWVAVVSMVLFCLGITLIQYIHICNKALFDNLVVGTVIFILLTVICLFIRMNSRARNVAQYAFDTAHENLKTRMEGKLDETYPKAYSFKRLLRYLIIPRYSDPQKALLTVMGCVSTFFLYRNQVSVSIASFNLFFVLLVFEYLVYQARYQINDIRGIKEDIEANKTNRFPYDRCPNLWHAIKCSVEVSILRVFLAFFINVVLFFENREYAMILFCGCLLVFISAFLYEIAREKGAENWIYILVGFGYPLRFFMGMIASVSNVNFFIGKLFYIPLLMSLWAYGSFASLLVWADEVAHMCSDNIEKNREIKCFKKKHYESIKLSLKKYCGKLNDKAEWECILTKASGVLLPWNVSFILALIFLDIGVFLITNSIFEKVILVFASIFFFLLSTVTRIKKDYIIGGIIALIVFSLLELWSGNTVIVLLSIYEVLLVMTYFGLRYITILRSIKPPNFLDGFLQYLIGETGYTCLKEKKDFI